MTPGRPKFLRQLLSFLPQSFIDLGSEVGQKRLKKLFEWKKSKFERGSCFDFYFGHVFDLRSESLILMGKPQRLSFAGVLFPPKRWKWSCIQKTLETEINIYRRIYQFERYVLIRKGVLFVSDTKVSQMWQELSLTEWSSTGLWLSAACKWFKKFLRVPLI